MVSPFATESSSQPAARFTPPDTVISQPEVADPVAETSTAEPVKVDYFADLENAEPVAIAGVDPKHMVNAPSEVAEAVGSEAPASPPPAIAAPTSAPTSDVFPFNLDSGPPLADPSGLLEDPLDIRNATPDSLDAAYFDHAQGHGVAFPTVTAGGQAGVPVQPSITQPAAVVEDLDEGPLSARLLIVSTILLAIIAFAVIQLDNPETVESIRDSFSALFG